MNKIMFFANLRDFVGEDYILMDARGKSIVELKKDITERYKNLSLDSVMVAINEEFASDGEVIKENDVIAFIPPVSGG